MQFSSVLMHLEHKEELHDRATWRLLVNENKFSIRELTLSEKDNWVGGLDESKSSFNLIVDTFKSLIKI